MSRKGPNSQANRGKFYAPHCDLGDEGLFVLPNRRLS